MVRDILTKFKSELFASLFSSHEQTEAMNVIKLCLQLLHLSKEPSFYEYAKKTDHS